jgi:hypothetical protein
MNGSRYALTSSLSLCLSRARALSLAFALSLSLSLSHACLHVYIYGCGFVVCVCMACVWYVVDGLCSCMHACTYGGVNVYGHMCVEACSCAFHVKVYVWGHLWIQLDVLVDALKCFKMRVKWNDDTTYIHTHTYSLWRTGAGHRRSDQRAFFSFSWAQPPRSPEQGGCRTHEGLCVCVRACVCARACICGMCVSVCVSVHPLRRRFVRPETAQDKNPEVTYLKIYHRTTYRRSSKRSRGACEQANIHTYIRIKDELGLVRIKYICTYV